MMKRARALAFVATLVAFLPLSTHAAQSFLDLTNSIVTLVNGGVIPLLYALAFLFFLIGMMRFFFAEGDENRKKGREFMLYALIGFVVLFSVWGLVALLLTLIHT